MPQELIIVAGPNGAGKTTFALELLAQQPCPYLSADLIAAELSPHDPACASIRAGRIFLDRVAEHLQQNAAFLIESTLSGRTLLHALHTARARGFRIVIAFVFLDAADDCILRVRERVRKGGHDVPPADIRRRFLRSQQNFWRIYRPLADEWTLYYNSAEEFTHVATGVGASVMALHNGSLFQGFAQTAQLEHDEHD